MDFETDLHMGDLLGCTSLRCVHEEGMTEQREKLTHNEAALQQALQLDGSQTCPKSRWGPGFCIPLRASQ